MGDRKINISVSERAGTQFLLLGSARASRAGEGTPAFANFYAGVSADRRAA
jgi:hypothetical protein